MPEKFLRQVADYYISSGTDLSGLTLVFPNRRSALFMRKYMHERMGATSFMPRMISITYFSQMFCPAALADNTELAFILYKVYCRVLTRHNREGQIPDFDSFYFWSRVLLNDFNDIDSYMVDTDQIFRNLAGINEIEANYLTPEQIEVAKILWGKDFTPADQERFWRHVNPGSGNDSATDKFLSLWEIMGELHTEFVAELDSRRVPITYSGLQSRRAAKAISEMGAGDFDGRRFAFIGFNVLPTSRVMIFKRLKQLGIAEFFWDIASPVLNPPEGRPHPAAETVLSLAKRFPMPEGFDCEPIDHTPDIEIIGVPSNVGQTKVVAGILDRLAGQGDTSEDRLLETSIVLADESLLMPMIYSIPDKISNVNVTMGIPYASTPFAALISSVFALQRNAYVTRGETHYFYRNVIEVLSHPHVSLIAPDEAVRLKEKIYAEHIYNVGAAMIADEFPGLAFIFTPIAEDADIAAVKEYVSTLVGTMSDRLRAHIPEGSEKFYELHILDAFAAHLEYLVSLTEKYNVGMRQHTMMQMLQNSLSGEKINFAGEPLKGLQVMSLDQTRVLDFENLVIVSANEKVFPRKNYSPSLIPNNLRAAYLLPTQQQEEASHAYHFFRLISRAKNVRLIYDSRTSDLSSGEMSRYLSQLIHLYPGLGAKQHNVEYRAEVKQPEAVVIHKTPEVLDELKAFLPGGAKRLSASALKMYISCPLQFYLSHVKGIRVSDESMDYIDAASYGSVVHKVMEQLYMPYQNQTINEHTIDKMMADDLETRALTVLDQLYYKSRYEHNLHHMPSEGRILARIIVKYIKILLEKEKEFTPFVFIDAEMGEHETFQWRVNDRRTLNFTMSIDRVDMVADPDDNTKRLLRFIDYKTGGDKLTTASVDKLFADHDLGGYLQLLIYCNAYASQNDYHEAIQPMIYKIQTVATGIDPLKYNRKPLYDYRAVNDEGFYEMFEDLIERIFEEADEHPFTQAEDDKNCLYCKFAGLCGRYPEKGY